MGKKRAGTKRRSPVANDIFYPDNRETVTGQLVSWGLKEGSRCPVCGGQVILAPHAAWDLTGNIAASAFAAVQESAISGKTISKTSISETGINRGTVQGTGIKPIRNINKVLILGPCHSGDEGIYLSESASFETPLGDLQVDTNINWELLSCSAFIKIYDVPHLMEHSLEVLLPLVKYCFPKAMIVPILVRGGKPAIISDLARALSIVFKDNLDEILVIVSSTVSQSPDPTLAYSMANQFNGLMESMDSGAFLSELAGGRINACGGPIIGALMESGLLAGQHFSALLPPTQGLDENGETIYYNAFASRPDNEIKELSGSVNAV